MRTTFKLHRERSQFGLKLGTFRCETRLLTVESQCSPVLVLLIELYLCPLGVCGFWIGRWVEPTKNQSFVGLIQERSNEAKSFSSLTPIFESPILIILIIDKV